MVGPHLALPPTFELAFLRDPQASVALSKAVARRRSQRSGVGAGGARLEGTNDSHLERRPVTRESKLAEPSVSHAECRDRTNAYPKRGSHVGGVIRLRGQRAPIGWRSVEQKDRRLRRRDDTTDNDNQRLRLVVQGTGDRVRLVYSTS